MSSGDSRDKNPRCATPAGKPSRGVALRPLVWDKPCMYSPRFQSYGESAPPSSSGASSTRKLTPTPRAQFERRSPPELGGAMLLTRVAGGTDIEGEDTCQRPGS